MRETRLSGSQSSEVLLGVGHLVMGFSDRDLWGLDDAENANLLLSAIVTWARPCGGSDQLHDLLDILLNALNFPARQIELSSGSGDLSVGPDGRYLLHANIDRFSARLRQHDPGHLCSPATAERSA